MLSQAAEAAGKDTIQSIQKVMASGKATKAQLKAAKAEALAGLNEITKVRSRLLLTLLL